MRVNFTKLSKKFLYILIITLAKKIVKYILECLEVNHYDF